MSAGTSPPAEAACSTASGRCSVSSASEVSAWAWSPNCGQNYFDANLEHLRLREVMDVAFCLDHLPSKIENVRAALVHLGCRDGVMVGDRRADIDAGRANGLRTVGCTYGFGTREELADADFLIAAPRELPAVLERAFPAPAALG